MIVQTDSVSEVSQFTLFGNVKKGNKPDFHEAADAATARQLYEYFYNQMRQAYQPNRVKDGVFQAMMEVELKNDGPVSEAAWGVTFRTIFLIGIIVIAGNH